ncbi:MAG: hypothetical protein HYY04_12300, partial [Chloroflexi bacterium]|nr:hypothetical protein [Chloroflexota bacterium]
APDFQNVREAGSLGCEIVAPADDLIWVHEGWVRTEADLRKLRQIDPLATGLQRRTIEFARRMRELADRYVVRLKDGAEIRPGATAQLPAGTMGPFTVAGQLAGVTELLVALYERPEFARELLAIVTDKIIDWMAYCEQTQGMGVLGIADDYAGNLSAPHFREFVLPCLRRIRSHFPGAWFRFHMCGKVDHLVPVLADELRIQEFGLFGFELDKRRVQAVMGGRVVLVGNVAPMNVYGGTPDSVLDESLEALHVFGQGSGGFILTDGANIPPGSPVENVNAMWRAARQVVREAAPSPPARRS